MPDNTNGAEDSRPEPTLYQIKNGWAARGKGWAVHGRTKEEAVQKYYEAEAQHREIDHRAFWFERRRGEGLQDGMN